MKGVIIFITSSFGHPVIMSNKPIRTLNDLKGMKIRGTGNMANMLNALGATAIAMPIFEVYDALQKGTVEAAMSGPDNFEAQKFAEVVKYATDLSFIAPNMITMTQMNEAKFKSLPPDVQKIITETSEKYRVTMAEQSEKINMGGFDYARAHGIEIISIAKDEQPTWQAIIKGLTDKFVADSAAKGIPAQDVATFIQQELAKAAK
jgi:TRAP-type C4-dicarboxylate transport system substrate-binding protein